MKGKDGNARVKFRLLLNTGSQSKFVTEELENLSDVEPPTGAKI